MLGTPAGLLPPVPPSFDALCSNSCHELLGSGHVRRLLNLQPAQLLQGKGVCQDGGAGSVHGWFWHECEYGTDCDDCGPRSPLPPPPVPSPPVSPPPPHHPPYPPQPPMGPDGSLCSNTCESASSDHYFDGDGVCDDGGHGAVYDACAYGTDCLDCGLRPAFAPWWIEAGKHWDSVMAKDKAETARAVDRMNGVLGKLVHGVGLFILLIGIVWLIHGLHFTCSNLDAFTAQVPTAVAAREFKDVSPEKSDGPLTSDDFCEYIGPNPYNRFGPPVYTGRRPYNLSHIVPLPPPGISAEEVRAKEEEIAALRSRAAELGVEVPSRIAMQKLFQDHLRDVGNGVGRPPHELARAVLGLKASASNVASVQVSSPGIVQPHPACQWPQMVHGPPRSTTGAIQVVDTQRRPATQGPVITGFAVRPETALAPVPQSRQQGVGSTWMPALMTDFTPDTEWPVQRSSQSTVDAHNPASRFSLSAATLGVGHIRVTQTTLQGHGEGARQAHASGSQLQSSVQLDVSGGSGQSRHGASAASRGRGAPIALYGGGSDDSRRGPNVLGHHGLVLL